MLEYKCTISMVDAELQKALPSVLYEVRIWGKAGYGERYCVALQSSPYIMYGTGSFLT